MLDSILAFFSGGKVALAGTGVEAAQIHYITNTTRSTTNTGGIAGGEAITIKGRGFTRGANAITAVLINNVTCTAIVVVDDSTITAVTPAGTVGLKVFKITSTNGDDSPRIWLYTNP